MNILIPDSWLRDYLKTKATPKQIKDCLSLCGPSVERIYTVNGETVYDIEITTNRVDAYSVRGIAREAAVILPQFGIDAKMLSVDSVDLKGREYRKAHPLDISIDNTHGFCGRILAMKLGSVRIGQSPKWMQRRLQLVGQRPINNLIDITNYVMWEIGHPVHAFDYDRLTQKKIIVREAKKGEHAVTLDNIHHTFMGGELIFDDGKGEIIDIPGIMGTANTVVTDGTKNVLLFHRKHGPGKNSHDLHELIHTVTSCNYK